jgi:hypothetical protein
LVEQALARLFCSFGGKFNVYPVGSVENDLAVQGGNLGGFII